MAATRRRLAPEDRRRHLIETALQVFAQQRYDETELEHVASEAGVQRPLIYHYFPGGKKALYLAVVEHAWQMLVAQLDVSGDEPPAERLPQNLGRYLDLIESDDAALAVVRQARRLEDPEVLAVIENASTAVAAGMAHNQLRDDKPSPVVLAGLRAFIGWFDVVLDQWRAGLLTRPQVEALVSETLPAVAKASARAGRE
jgi:AcrR family transcriptional regulator